MNQGEIELIPFNIEQAFGDLQSRIMSDIVRRIRINGFVTRSADWQITRLKQLGESDASIKKWIRETLKLSDVAIDDIYAETLKQEYLRNAALYQSTGNVLIPFAKNKEMQDLIGAIKKQTKEKFDNITRSMGFITKDGGQIKALDLTRYYQKTLDSALGDIGTGAFDYNSALKRTVKDMTNSGLRWIDYESGYHSRVTVASRRAAMTGFNQVVSHMNDGLAKDLKTNSFEVTWHAGARPEHMAWQGKVYTKEQLSSVCGLGSATGLKGINCYHDYLPFVPGASTRNYTNKQLTEMNAAELKSQNFNGKEYTKYEAIQRQRQLETNMRAYRQEVSLLKQGSADSLDIRNAQSKYHSASAEYIGLSKAMNLPQQRSRILLDGLGKV